MNILFLIYPLNALLIITAPIALGIVLTRGFKTNWYLFWVGAAAFVISQVGHIPFNYFLTLLFQRGVLPAPPAQYALVFNSVVLGLSAGLWEQLTNYGVYRWWVKDARTWKQGVMLGAGHGGIEALITGLLALVAFFQLVGLRSADLTAIQPEQLAQVKAQVDAYWSAPWFIAFMPFLERIFAMTLQVSFSLLVLQTFLRRKWLWLGLAIGFHALVDAVAVYSAITWGASITMALLGGFALLGLFVIFALKRTPEAVTEEETPPPPLPVPLKPDQIQDPEATSDKLEETRYQS